VKIVVIGMRSVYSLCAVVFLGLIANAALAASVSLQNPLPFLKGYTAAHALLVWWFYVAPPFTFAAFALLVWKSWMEAVPRKTKILAWSAVAVAAGVNLLAAIHMISLITH
jgi:hypothetical protein